MRLFALWGVGVVVEASRGSWTVSWDDDRTQEFTLGASLAWSGFVDRVF